MHHVHNILPTVRSTPRQWIFCQQSPHYEQYVCTYAPCTQHTLLASRAKLLPLYFTTTYRFYCKNSTAFWRPRKCIFVEKKSILVEGSLGLPIQTLAKIVENTFHEYKILFFEAKILFEVSKKGWVLMYSPDVRFGEEWSCSETLEEKKGWRLRRGSHSFKWSELTVDPTWLVSAGVSAGFGLGSILLSQH